MKQSIFFELKKKSMKKILKWVIICVSAIIILVIIAGIYKFNYLANQLGYDVDGNKIENKK